MATSKNSGGYDVPTVQGIKTKELQCEKNFIVNLVNLVKFKSFKYLKKKIVSNA